MEHDRKLLERAALAAGIVDFEFGETCAGGWAIFHGNGYAECWNPLDDDGDALRLAIKLQLSVENEHLSAGCAYCTLGQRSFPEVRSGAYDDKVVIDSDYAATRRAIVIAAAEIAGE